MSVSNFAYYVDLAALLTSANQQYSIESIRWSPIPNIHSTLRKVGRNRTANTANGEASTYAPHHKLRHRVGASLYRTSYNSHRITKQHRPASSKTKSKRCNNEGSHAGGETVRRGDERDRVGACRIIHCV